MIQLCVRKIGAFAAATPTDAGVAAAVVAVVEQRSVVALTVVETAADEALDLLMVE